MIDSFGLLILTVLAIYALGVATGVVFTLLSKEPDPWDEHESGHADLPPELRK